VIASIASRPTFRDDAHTSLFPRRDNAIKSQLLKKRKRNIFDSGPTTRNSLIHLTEFGFCAGGSLRAVSALPSAAVNEKFD